MSTILPCLAFFNLGSGDMLIVLFLCLLMFGSKKLPDLAKAMGQSIKEFKKAANEVEDNFHSAVKEEDRKKALAQLPPPAPTPPAPAAGGPLDTIHAKPGTPPEKL